MSSWIEVKYIGLLSSQLRNYKKKSHTLYCFSCPICGDSTKNKTKTRGYIYEKGGRFFFHCHNCSVSLTVENFIKHVDPHLHEEFIAERLLERGTSQRFSEPVREQPIRRDIDPLQGLKKISALSDTDPCRLLVTRRKIPSRWHHRLFSCPNFYQYTNKLVSGKFPERVLKYDRTRLLIPFLASDGHCHAYTGRALAEDHSKYITIILDENVPKIFGLKEHIPSQWTYVFEGPIDSMFVPNSLAVAGGDLTSVSRIVDKANTILVYDNEPRQIHTVKKMRKAINLGYRVCFWPESIKEKDINEMVLGGMSEESIKNTIDISSCSGLTAEARLLEWRKIRED